MEGEYDSKVDVWLTGVLMYQMLTKDLKINNRRLIKIIEEGIDSI